MRYALCLLVFSLLVAPLSAAPVTYQGQLQQQGLPTNNPVNLDFRLFDAATGGNLVGSIQERPNWPVSDGLFQVELDFGANAFDGNARFLEIRINGAPLTPRQAVTATPHALIAVTTVPGAIGSSQINSTQVQSRVTGSCPAGQYIQSVNQDGTVVCGAEPPSWRLGGNAGTSSTTNFLGTTDNQALELRTANVRSLRIEPSAQVFGGLPITVNVIAGSHANVVTPGVRGATISGGGVPSGDSDPNQFSEGPNLVTDNYGTVGGGYNNQAGDDAGTTNDQAFATVGGGLSNTASGNASTIAGGDQNIASGFKSTVGGGRANTASENYSTVGGGLINTASGLLSTVSGGGENFATASYSTVGGGYENLAIGPESTVGGGVLNAASETYSTIGGGRGNTANGEASSVGGGFSNDASGKGSIIGGGRFNTSSGAYSNVSGGSDSLAGGRLSTVGGGAQHTASGEASTVGGGFENRASDFSTVSGGIFNTASGDASIVTGGSGNTASGAFSTVAGGAGNCAGARYSWAGGFRAKVRPATNPGAGSCSGLTYPGGNGDEGTFIWADNTNEDFVSQRPNQFRVRANGGAEFQTGVHGLVAFSNSSTSAGAAIQGESVHPDGIAIVGRNESTDATMVLNNRGTGPIIRAFRVGTLLMQLSNTGNLFIAGALTQNSDRDQKEAVESVDVDQILDQLAKLDISSWRYLGSDPGVRHIGPMAQDFHAAFGFGVSETTISAVDAQGIAFAAIQALNQRLLESQAEVAVLKVQAGQMRELADRNAELERRLGAMEERERENDGLRDRLAALETLLIQDRQLAERAQ